MSPLRLSISEARSSPKLRLPNWRAMLVTAIGFALAMLAGALVAILNY